MISITAEILQIVEAISAPMTHIKTDGNNKVIDQQFEPRLLESENALHESQTRLFNLIDSAMDAIISINSQQQIVLFNTAAEQMFLCPHSEALGQPIERFIPERFRVAHRQHIELFGQAGVTNRAMGKLSAISGLRANGQEFPIEAAISKMETSQGQVYTVILRDISRRKEAELEIHRLNAELEQRVADRTAELTVVNKELEAFAYSVSHDLRAPLRHIDGFVTLLKKKASADLNPQAQRYLDIIADAARKMGTLIDELLSFSRMSRAELVRQPINMENLVRDVIREFEHDEKQSPISWQIGSLPNVTADMAMLRLVLVNLLSNAVKFSSKQQQPVIEIGSIYEQPDDPVFFVHDNGAGFNMEYADKLFGVFQRLHRADEFEGIGIGLANVKRIIHRHGGRVWAKGEIDAGATFYFSLPTHCTQG